MSKVRWGVIGNAKIGWEKVLPAMLNCEHAEMYALASRNPAKAQPIADKFGFTKLYDSYEGLLADPQVEAVYIPLPNHEHVSWTLKAAAAGKHVLCEKPMGLNAQEVEQLRAVGDKVQIMEAFMVRFHPQWLRVRERVRSGEIGNVVAIQAFFSYFNRDGNNIRNQADIGGGALFDIGCYPIVISRFLLEREPVRALALVDRDPQFQTDRLVSALVDYGQGQRLDFTVSTQCVPYQRVQVIGSKGRIEVQIPFNAPLGGPSRIFSNDGSQLDDNATRVEVIPSCDMYTLEVDAFSRAIRDGQALPWGVEDAIAQMRVIDALFASEKADGWAPV
jgi:predicted dehydrogenase